MFARSLLKTPVLRLRLARFQSTFKLNTNSIAFKYSQSPVLKFTEEHEWVAIHPDGTSFVGITNHASDALGDATYIELPQDDVGTEVAIGDTVGSIESVKSASDIYSPIQGEILEVNEELDSDPSLINKDPMGEGWIVKLQAKDNGEGLMDAEQYEQFVKESDH